MFLYITAIPPPLLPLSVLNMLKPYPLIVRIVSPENSVNKVSVMKAMSTVSRACITMSGLLQIERTFHNTQDSEVIVVGGQTCFLMPDSMEYYHGVYFELLHRLGIWVRWLCDHHVSD